ncbi:MAG: 50S ribosomal protein L29 [Armatimonadetes bacterium]|nr:50S ribosomal protein L29 [Armatimonadota bacterium]
MSRSEDRAELRDLGLPELQQRLKEAREELFENRVRYATRILENPEPLRKGRKKIARILTYITQRENAGA